MEKILSEDRVEHQRQLEEIKMATRNVTEAHSVSEESKQNSTNSSAYTTAASGEELQFYTMFTLN